MLCQKSDNPIFSLVGVIQLEGATGLVEMFDRKKSGKHWIPSILCVQVSPLLFVAMLHGARV